MREQVAGQKVGNRSGMVNSRRSNVQRPSSRSGGNAKTRVRQLLHYLPNLLKVVMVVGVILLGLWGYRAAASASFFQVQNVNVAGVSRASTDRIQSRVRSAVGATGVWNADLESISADLAKLPWVRSAIVSRVLPDEIRVRITERLPTLVVRLSSGKFMWVDDDAVLLAEMQPSDQMPPFFLRGWNEDETDTARKENRERVQSFLFLQQEWQAAGLAERVSEVNLNDIRDVRAQLAGDDSQIEVRLGGEELSKRLGQALEVLDEQRQSSRGNFITYVDVSQGKRAIIGFAFGAHRFSDEMLAGEDSNRTEVGATAINKRAQVQKEPEEKRPRDKRQARN